MRLVFGIIVLWLLVYDNAAMFKLLHSFLIGLLQ